ncbi:hypothetical protein [Methanosarcina mazei]|nr:hypothetical protein [Methanosarcina mazei]
MRSQLPVIFSQISWLHTGSVRYWVATIGLAAPRKPAQINSLG